MASLLSKYYKDKISTLYHEKYAKKIPKNHLYSRTIKISDNILKKQTFSRDRNILSVCEHIINK